LTNEKTKHWSGKPSDPEFQNYTKNAFAEVFKIEPVFEKGYPSYKAVNDKPKWSICLVCKKSLVKELSLIWIMVN